MGRKTAAVVVVSLERGFQGENLSLWTAGDCGLGHHLQFKQVGEQDGFFTFGAVAAKPQGTAENVVLCTTSVTNLSLAADAAFVHGVGHECTAPTELSTQLTLVDGSKLDVAESERLLAVGWRAIASTRAQQWA